MIKYIVIQHFSCYREGTVTDDQIYTKINSTGVCVWVEGEGVRIVVVLRRWLLVRGDFSWWVHCNGDTFSLKAVHL